MSYRASVAAFAVTVASLLVGVPVGYAQEEETPPGEETVVNEAAEATEAAEPAAMEEIVVISPRPGSRRSLDEDYEDPVKAKLLKEFYRMQELDEEYAWRDAAETDPSSRIRWGYDPRDEYRMRNDTALQDLSWEKTKPATIFRFEF
ncbi:MAG: hypothetical protein R3192_15900 [Woeseiaceae bacterium]|nr:hypothetical protein [Woeseiaceae bacterium]